MKTTVQVRIMKTLCFITTPDGEPYERAGVRGIKAKYSWPATLRVDFLLLEWKLGREKEPLTFRGTCVEFGLCNRAFPGMRNASDLILPRRY